MKKGRPVLILLLFVLSLSVAGQPVNDDRYLSGLVQNHGQADVSIPFTGMQDLMQFPKSLSVTSVKNGRIYINLSPRTLGWFLGQKFNYTIIPSEGTKGIAVSESTQQAMNWQSYPTYRQYLEIMKSFADNYPSICRLDTIGNSVRGQKVLVLKISDNVAAEEDEPEVFYSSTIHGDELGGFILMMRLADSLLSSYNSSQRIKSLIDNLQIYINPLSNPDGTYNNDSTVSNCIRYNAHSYDLNRNFPDPVYPYNAGNVQQKEVTDMVKFIDNHRFVISANFHAGMEIVNYPWDYPDNKSRPRHADNNWFVHVSRMYADTVHLSSPSNYMYEYDNGIVLGYVWYPVNGGRQDYVTWYRHGREVTIELDYTKETSSSNLDSLWKYNRKSLIDYLGNAMYGIHGHVKDSVTLKPVEALVFIKGHDCDSSQVYSDSQRGSFTRLIMPGTWDLTFSANGYYDTTITCVVTSDTVPVSLTVFLVPRPVNIDTVRPHSPYIWPNPSTLNPRFALPPSVFGNITVTIVDMSGRKVKEYETVYYQGGSNELDVSGVSRGSYFVIFRNMATGAISTGRVILSDSKY